MMQPDPVKRFIEALEGALAASWRIRHRRDLDSECDGAHVGFCHARCRGSFIFY